MQSRTRRKLSLALLALAVLTPSAPARAASSDAAAMTTFGDAPVTVTAPDDAAQWVSLRLEMEGGQCKVSRESKEGEPLSIFMMGQGTWKNRLPAGQTLRLDPQGHPGTYSLQMTPEGPVNLYNHIVSGLGMMLVAVVAVILWRRISRAPYRWFWVGAGLWTLAVAVKVLCEFTIGIPVLVLLKQHLSYPWLVVSGGLYVGVQSSLCEMGFTLLAVWIWRSLGRDAGRAIAVGVGAGAFEAFLLGLAPLTVAVIVAAKLPGTNQLASSIAAVSASTSLLWLIGPTERVIAILVHASSRALILLGVVNHRWGMVLGGFAIFTLIDTVAGAAHVSGKLGTFSMWWIELAILPCAIVSVPILRACYRRWKEPAAAAVDSSSVL